MTWTTPKRRDSAGSPTQDQAEHCCTDKGHQQRRPRAQAIEVLSVRATGQPRAAFEAEPEQEDDEAGEEAGDDREEYERRQRLDARQLATQEFEGGALDGEAGNSAGPVRGWYDRTITATPRPACRRGL